MLSPRPDSNEARPHAEHTSMTVQQISNLPSGWVASETGAGVDLCVASSRRKYLVAAVIAMAVAAGWKASVEWSTSSRGDVVPWLLITMLLMLFAGWCALGTEVWRLQKNSLAHRVGVRGWGYSQRYQDADLQIVLHYTAQFSIPCFRLYAVVDGKRHFLIERGKEELQQLASFIAFHTGWSILP